MEGPVQRRQPVVDIFIRLYLLQAYFAQDSVGWKDVPLLRGHVALGQYLDHQIPGRSRRPEKESTLLPYANVEAPFGPF